MAKRQLNKNVVFGLTVAAMLLVTGSVGAFAYSASQRDPALYIKRAKDAEQAGNLKRAVELYKRAYNAGRDANNLAEAARCEYQRGEFALCINLLRYANAQAPQDARVLTTLLELFWEMRSMGLLPPALVEIAFDYSQRLNEVDPKNVFGLVMTADLVDQRNKPEEKEIGEKAIQRAVELAPQDARVALIAAGLNAKRDAQRIVDDTSIASPEARDAKFKEVSQRLLDALRAGVAANPKDGLLITRLAQQLYSAGQRDESLVLLEQAARDLPDEEEVHYLLAQTLVNRAADPASELTDAQKVELLDRAIALIDRATTVEPAIYACYNLKAQALRLKYMAQGRWDTERADRQQEIFDMYVAAQAATAGRTTLRAKLGDALRAEMIGTAAELAIIFHQNAADDKSRTKAMEFAKRFQSDLHSQFKEWVYRYVIDGRMAQVEGDTISAIKAYKRAEELGVGDQQATRIVKEQLVELYMNSSPGLALRYADDTLALYARMGTKPPRDLCWRKASILLLLEKPREAIAFLDSIDRQFPDDKELRTLRARAVAISGNTDEGIALLQQAAPNDFFALLERGRIAASAGDTASAKETLEKAIDLRPDDLRAIRLYVQVMMQGEKDDPVSVKNRQTCTAKLAELADKSKDDAFRRVMETYKVLLANTNETERDAALLALINQTPDACERAAELVNFWWSRRDWDKVEQHMPEWVKCRGEDNVEVMLTQFNLALRRQKPDDAEKLATRLATQNVDRVGGSTFRGEVKIARDDMTGALAEFRSAERELPGDVGIKLKLAEVLLRHTPPRLPEAVQVLTQAVEFNPRSFDANKLLFAALEEMGKTEEALPALARAHALNPNDPFIRERQRLVDEAKDPKSGIQWRTERLAKKPDDLNNLGRLVELHEKANQYAEGEAILKAALAREEKPTLQLVSLAARFYASAKRRTEGEELLRAYAARCEGVDKVDALLLMGRFYEHLGDSGAALSAYLECEKRIDEFAGADADLKRRARLIVAKAMAEFYGRVSQFAQMAEAYRIALANLTPEMAAEGVELRIKLIKGLLASNQTEAAKSEIEQFAAANPRDIRGQQLQAELILRGNVNDKSMADARDLLNKVIAEQPNNTFALFLRGKVLAAQRNFNDARADLLRCKAIDPSAYLYEPRVELAKLYETTGQTGAAETELRELLTEKPHDRKAIQRLVDFFQRTDQLAKAQTLLAEEIAHHTSGPDEWFWRHQLGKLLMKRAQFAPAVSELQRASQLAKGEEPEVNADLINAMSSAGRPAETAKLFTALPPAGIDSRVQRALAEAYVRQGMKKDAIQQFERALKQAADRLVDEAGEVVDHMVRTVGLEEAIAATRRTIEASDKAEGPTRLRLQLVLGRALVLSPDNTLKAEGLKLVEQVLAEAPPRSRLTVSALLVRALALDGLNRTADAVKAYEDALAIQNDAVQALNNVAYLLADRLNKPKEALPYAETAARLMPGNSDVQDTVGWIYHMIGNNGQAETSLLESVRLNPTNVAAIYHLGKVYEAEARSSDARKMHERVMELCKGGLVSPYCAMAQDALNKLK